jgi:hypothetical protein
MFIYGKKKKINCESINQNKTLKLSGFFVSIRCQGWQVHQLKMGLSHFCSIVCAFKIINKKFKSLKHVILQRADSNKFYFLIFNQSARLTNKLLPKWMFLLSSQLWDELS